MAAVEYCLARPHVLIGDEPGLGKTSECIMLSNAIEARRTLVVCPASLRLNWEREVWRWSTVENVQTYPVLAARDGVSPNAHYVIISYDLLRNEAILAALMGLRWDHMVLDEGHYLKDPKGNKRVRAITGWYEQKKGQPTIVHPGLDSVAGRITAASGSIMPNQPIEVYNTARLLDWDCIDRMTVDGFRDYYYAKGGGFVVKNVDGEYKTVWSNQVRNQPRHLDQLREKLRSRIMVRRRKRDVLKELPPRQWHPFPLATTPGMRKALRHPGWAEAERLFELDPDGFAEAIPVDGSVSTARRLLGEEKADAVADYVCDLVAGGVEKVIVAAWHRTPYDGEPSVLQRLRARLEHLGLTYMDGGTSQKKKQQAVDDFQEKHDVRIILGQMGPLGEGWTLTAAQDVVLAEPYWVPGKNDQLLDRVHRFGQEGDRVIGHIPVVPNSLDERVMNVVIEKDRNIKEALDG